jgi:hypothetical protein
MSAEKVIADTNAVGAWIAEKFHATGQSLVDLIGNPKDTFALAREYEKQGGVAGGFQAFLEGLKGVAQFGILQSSGVSAVALGLIPYTPFALGTLVGQRAAESVLKDQQHKDMMMQDANKYLPPAAGDGQANSKAVGDQMQLGS